MHERKYINFERAIELNQTKPVGLLFNDDETWFPVNCLWLRKISELPLGKYKLADLKHGVWVHD